MVYLIERYGSYEQGKMSAFLWFKFLLLTLVNEVLVG